MTWTTWEAWLRAFDSPVLNDGTFAYEAAKPHSRLCCACLVELGNIDAEDPRSRAKNPFSLQTRGSFRGLEVFDSWVEGIEAWVERVPEDADESTERMRAVLWDAMDAITEVQVATNDA